MVPSANKMSAFFLVWYFILFEGFLVSGFEFQVKNIRHPSSSIQHFKFLCKNSIKKRDKRNRLSLCYLMNSNSFILLLSSLLFQLLLERLLQLVQQRQQQFRFLLHDDFFALISSW